MLKHNRFTVILKKGWLLCFGIILTACLNQATPTVPVIYLRSPQAGLTSPTPFQPHGTHTPTPPDPLTDTPTPASTATATPSPTLAIIAGRIPIIEYHYSEYAVGDQVMMKTAWFKDQMAWLADNGFVTLSAADLVSYLNGSAFPVKSVVLSFDLGTARRDDFNNVIIPTLKQHGFKGLFFLLVNSGVITDTCETKTGKFCWDDLRQWQKDGVASIESHGLTHPDYATLNQAQMRWDAGQAYQIIGDKIGIPPLGFAYPYDSVPSQAPKVIESLGYQFAVGGFARKDRSVHIIDSDRFILPRVYPYSNLAIYPAIGGAAGKTYGEMLMSDIEGVAGTLTPTVTNTPTPTKAPSSTPKK